MTAFVIALAMGQGYPVTPRLNAMSGDESLRKRALRAELRGRRRTLTSSERESATAAFAQHLTELVTTADATTIAAFLPAQDEPDIRPFLAWAGGAGIRILMPVSREDGLLDWVVDVEGEVVGSLGVPEPVGELLGPMAVDEVDLMLIPAAAVDRTGMRLGWGRGYFDRLIGSMEAPPPIYAVIFETEILDTVPTELHDRPVDGVVTPEGITTFAPA